jgi:hypothetical protein
MAEGSRVGVDLFDPYLFPKVFQTPTQKISGNNERIHAFLYALTTTSAFGSMTGSR